MSKVVITEKNYKQVFGRLKKFFNHDNLLIWHQFDCGSKKRIGHFIHHDAIVHDDGTILIHEHITNVMHKIISSECIVSDDSLVFYFDDTYYGEFSCAALITIGDEISFLGNRIIIKTPSPVDMHRYLYECIQIGGQLDMRTL